MHSYKAKPGRLSYRFPVNCPVLTLFDSAYIISLTARIL